MMAARRAAFLRVSGIIVVETGEEGQNYSDQRTMWRELSLARAQKSREG